MRARACATCATGGCGSSIPTAPAQTEHVVDVQELKQDMWGEATVDFKGPKLGDRVDELHWLLPRSAELLLDDVTLYVPGR